jgi:NAD(P)-dependent dehydrogenase (short-subunit alcohol dehydrogenase family)
MAQRSGSEWFTGRSAIVTGAAHGIGRGIAEMLETLGAQVIAVDKDERALEDSFGTGGWLRWQGDLAHDDAEQLAKDIWRRHGPVQLLVNNVGTDTPARFLDLSQADFDLVFNTNLRGPWFFTKQIARHLVDARLAGAIVFVSSLHDSFIRTHPHYSASKAAVAMLVKEVANELAPHGIRVNAVSPGRIWPGRNALRTEQEANVRRFVPLGRVGQPADVARMVAVLLSDEWSGYVTGANVRVDGGLGLHSWSVDDHANGPPGGAHRMPGRLVRRLRRRSQ